MELNTDWRGFQAVFHPRKRLGAEESTAPVFVVVEGSTVLALHSDGDDLSEHVGRTYQEISAQLPHRELILIPRAQADSAVQGVLTLPHFYDQTEKLRETAQAQVLFKNKLRKGQGEDLPLSQHFLLQAIRTWWAKLLPSAYGIYLRIDGQDGPESKGGKPARHYFMVVRRGRLDQFITPDLSIMIPDRRKVPADVVKFLAERNGVPVQGIFATSEQWAHWSESKNPWVEIAAAVKKDNSVLIPTKWGIAAMIGARAFFGV